MGTRNLTCVYLDGSCKVAQYGQWDGYPSGQGATALAFLRDLTPEQRAKFEEKLRALPVLSDEQVKQRWTECGADSTGWVGLDVSRRFQARYPWLSRDAGADILGMVLDGSADGVQLAESFAKDSLFCEWAYVIDLDKNALEVYRGFNQTPLADGERFYSATANDSGYYPICLVRSWPLGELPDEATFVKELEKGDDEDADE